MRSIGDSEGCGPAGQPGALAHSCPSLLPPCAPCPALRQPPGESDMAVSDALLPSFSTFASGPAGREKTLRPAGAPNNVSVAQGPREWLVGFLRAGVGTGGTRGSLGTTGRREGAVTTPTLQLSRDGSGSLLQLCARVRALRCCQRVQRGPDTSPGALAVGWALAAPRAVGG